LFPLNIDLREGLFATLSAGETPAIPARDARDPSMKRMRLQGKPPGVSKRATSRLGKFLTTEDG